MPQVASAKRERPPDAAPSSLAARVRTTVELLARRGYALPLERVAELLHGGPAPADAVRAAVDADPALSVTRGLVHPASDATLVPASEARARAHAAAAPRWTPVAVAYARALVRHCPWVDCVLVSGSLASGGFDERDDLDFSLVVEDERKYLAYVVALAVALPFAWRHRAKPHGAAAAMPLLPKLVCINVVWTRAQATPFERQDDAMALEALLSRPVHGADAWRGLLARNPGLLARFPQLLAVPPIADVRARPSIASRALRSVARGRLGRALDHACYHAVRALHASVRRWRRRRDPRAIAHVDAMEALKRPYGILERPRLPRDTRRP